MAIRYIDEGDSSSEPIAAEVPTTSSRIRYLEDPAERPLSPQQVFEQQFIQQGTRSVGDQVLSALIAQPKAGVGLVTGLADILYKGIQGAGSMAQKASDARELALSQPGFFNKLRALAGEQAGQVGDVLQTAGEVGPRTIAEIVNAARQGFQSPETATQTLRSIGSVANPLAAAIQALVSPQAAPTPARAQQAFEENVLNQAISQSLDQPILQAAQEAAGLPVSTETNVDVARAIPLLFGAEALPGAAMSVARTLPQLIKQFGRTGATLATTPLGSFPRAAKAAEPFLSGTRLAEAEVAADSAIARQAALDRAIQKSLIEEQAATQQGLQGVAESRGTAAAKGREALAAQRELRTAEGTIAPEIVLAKASIEEAAQLPPVILGRTAQEAPAFGRNTINAIEKSIAASEAEFTAKFTAVDKSLPAKQQKLEAQAAFDSAAESSGELSQGFEAYNKGAIKRILDESTRITPGESTVTPGIQQLFDNETPATKAGLITQYPELAQPVKGTIPQYTFSELQARLRQINQGITQALKYGDTNDARILGNLKRGFTQSMEDYASQVGGKTYDLFKDANASFAAHQNKFGLNRVQTLFKDDVLQNPELVARDLIAFDNPSQVNAIKSIVSPEEFIPVQAQFSQKFFSPTFDVPFDPSHFVKQFSKPGARDTVKAVFGEQGLADFNRIYDASQSFAKISDLQKTLDTLASQSESATAAFAKAKGAATEAQNVLAQKNALKAQLKPIQNAKTKADIAAVNADLNAAFKELDRVRTYKDLRDWATRASGLNIVEVATTSPAWEQLARYSALHLDKYQEPIPQE